MCLEETRWCPGKGVVSCWINTSSSSPWMSSSNGDLNMYIVCRLPIGTLLYRFYVVFLPWNIFFLLGSKYINAVLYKAPRQKKRKLFWCDTVVCWSSTKTSSLLLALSKIIGRGGSYLKPLRSPFLTKKNLI